MDTKNGSSDVELGKPSKQSDNLESASSGSKEKESVSKYQCILQAARGFYPVAFLFILLAVTIFFASLLPSNYLRGVPWICLTFIVLIVFGLAVYEGCRPN